MPLTLPTPVTIFSIEHQVNMRLITPILALFLTSAIASADDTPVVTQPCAASQSGCEVSKQDQKRAKKIFEAANAKDISTSSEPSVSGRR